MALDFDDERSEDEHSCGECEGGFFPPVFIWGEGFREIVGAGQLKEAREEVGADAEDGEEEEALVAEEALQLDPVAGEFGVVVLGYADGGGGEDTGEGEGGEDEARGRGILSMSGAEEEESGEVDHEGEEGMVGPADVSGDEAGLGGEVECCEGERIAGADWGCGEHAGEGGAEETEDESGE